MDSTLHFPSSMNRTQAPGITLPPVDHRLRELEGQLLQSNAACPQGAEDRAFFTRIGFWACEVAKICRERGRPISRETAEYALRYLPSARTLLFLARSRLDETFREIPPARNAMR